MTSGYMGFLCLDVMRKLKTMNSFNNNLFDIEKIKKHLDSILNVIEQTRYLHRVKINFLQRKEKWVKKDCVPLDEQIDVELKYRFFESNFKLRPAYIKCKSRFAIKLTVVENLRPLALSFLALARHKGDNGLPYLSISDAQLIYFLSNVLQDENGWLIPRNTIADMLLPNISSQDRTIHSINHLEDVSAIDSKLFYRFDIEVVKDVIQTLVHYDDRVLFLYRVHANYKQHRNPIDHHNMFSSQIELELQKQRDLNFLKEDQFTPFSAENRIAINGRVNVLMTFFYELLVEFPERYDLKCLKNSKREVIKFVLQYFKRKNGNTISSHFLRNTLTPSRFDKRCSIDKQVDIKSIWNIH